MATPKVPTFAPSVNGAYYQQIHAEDGGELVLVARSRTDWQIACKHCKTLWHVNSPFALRLAELPTEMQPIAAGDAR